MLKLEVNRLVEVELVVEALVAKKLVVVALVVVLLRAVKFCRVVEPVTVRLENEAAPPACGRQTPAMAKQPEARLIPPVP